MKIGFRITLIMIVVSLVSIGVLGSVLIARAWNNAEDLAMDLTKSKSRQMGGEFRLFLELNWQKVARTAETMGGLFEAVPDFDRRRFMNEVLSNIIANDEHIVAAFTVWEPDALEGNDRAWMDAPGSDPETGRFLPAFVRTTHGDLLMINVYDYETADFYVQPARFGRQIITDPYSMEIAGEDRVMATISAPIRNTANQIVGVVGIDLDLAYLNVMGQDTHRIFDGQTTADTVGYSNNGTIVSHFIPGNVGRDMRETEAGFLGSHLDPLRTAIQRGHEYTFDGDVGGGSMVRIFVTPVAIADSPSNWAIGVGFPVDEIHAGTHSMIWFAVFLCVVMVAAIVPVALWMSRSIVRPIRKMAGTLRNIATGDGDLTVRLPDDGRDEIDEASGFFNKTIDKIRELVISIKGQATKLADIGDDLASNMTETASAMNEIAANIQSIKTRVLNQSASVTETNATMEQVTVNIDKLSGHVQKQTHAVSQSSSAIEEMLANIQSVTSTLVKNASNVNDLRESSDSGRSSLQEVAGDIQEIARESEGLLEINSVMENIASQTNLLSMNAAIEAAHAGEAGKGFAVVADEIRKLAESSSEQSKTIGTVLKKIKGSIDKITRSTDNVLQKFEAIDHGVRTVAEQEDIIRAAMEEQGEGSRQVLQASGQVSEITQQVKGGSQEMLEGSREVIHESKNLEIVTQEITNGINEMAVGADQVNRAVNSVSDLSGKNRENISVLVQAVSRFKV